MPPNLDTLLHANPLQLRPWRRAFLLKHLNGLMLTHHLDGPSHASLLEMEGA